MKTNFNLLLCQSSQAVGKMLKLKLFNLKYRSTKAKEKITYFSPDNRRFHTKTDMRNFLEHNKDESLKPYESALLDFGVHLKLARRMGWVVGGKPSSSKKRKEERKERKEKRKRKKMANVSV